MPNVNRQTIYQMGNVVNDVVKQATGRDIVKQIDMGWVTVEQQKKEMLNVYTGDFINYDAINTDPLKSVKAFIQPVQDLNGYSKPWVGGAGKNIANFIDGYGIGDDGTVSASSARCATVDPIIIDQSNSYVVSGVEGTAFIYSVWDNETLVRREASVASGTVLNVSNGTLLYVCAYIANGNATVAQNKPQLEIGTTPTTYEPYSNICPITGYAEGNIYHSGMNIVGGDAMKSIALHTNPANISWWESGRYLYFTKDVGLGKIIDGVFKENTQYTFILTCSKNSGVASLMRIYYTDGTFSAIPDVGGPGEKYTLVRTSTEGKTVAYLGGTTANYSGTVRVYVDESGIFEGVLTADDFVNFDGDVYNYDWTGTVYNGVIDPTKSDKTVTSDMLSLDLDTLTWEYDSTYNRFVSTAVNGIVPPDSNDTAGNIISSAYQVITANQTTIETNVYGIAINTYGEIIINDARFTTVSDFLTGIDGYQLVYQTTEVVYYNFTGVDIASLAGDNNIWSDVGDMEVIYAYKEDIL